MATTAMNTHPHAQLIHDTRLALGREPDFTLWNNSKVVYSKGKPMAKPGLGRGSTDLIGVLAPHGRLVALEGKTGQAVPTKEQKLFMELVKRRGGFAAIIHSVEEAKAALDRARKGLSE